MGLDIYGETTEGHLGAGYSALHMNTRYLALRFSGAPEFLDDDNQVLMLSFYMHPWTGDKKFNSEKLQNFFFALQISGMEFPNILLHSDCKGGYTKRGKLDTDGSLLTGNSVQLMKELEVLVNEPEFQKEKYERQMKYTTAFYELVKKEVTEGKGIILFG